MSSKDFLPPEPPDICNVCNGESGSGGSNVCCSALGAVSFNYCDACLAAGAEPAGVVRGMAERMSVAALLGSGLSQVRVWERGRYTLVAALPRSFWSDSVDHSEDLASAFALVEGMHGVAFRLHRTPDRLWSAYFAADGAGPVGRGATPALAIRRAALLWAEANP